MIESVGRRPRLKLSGLPSISISHDELEDEALETAETQPLEERDSEDCTTTESFDDHDIEDGSALIQQTYYRLASADRTEFEPTASFFDALESAFVWTYLGIVEENGMPDHVEAAINDARALTAEEFDDRSGADLRTEVVSTFYRYAAGFHCAYRET